MSTETPTCRKCGGSCKPGIAAKNDDLYVVEDHYTTVYPDAGRAELIPCLKCEVCGHSFVLGTPNMSKHFENNPPMEVGETIIVPLPPTPPAGYRMLSEGELPPPGSKITVKGQNFDWLDANENETRNPIPKHCGLWYCAPITPADILSMNEKPIHVGFVPANPDNPATPYDYPYDNLHPDLQGAMLKAAKKEYERILAPLRKKVEEEIARYREEGWGYEKVEALEWILTEVLI